MGLLYFWEEKKMTLRFRKKNRRQRGTHTHGWGAKKKHRGKGSKGGHGYAGSHKHKYSYIVNYEPEHFGYKGFVRPRKKEAKIINVGDIEKILATREHGEILDLASLGYNKLLSKGKISVAVKIRILQCSEKAKLKVEKAGGVVVE